MRLHPRAARWQRGCGKTLRQHWRAFAQAGLTMAMGRVELDQSPGTFVSGSRARWLLQARRARLTASGTILIFDAEGVSPPNGQHTLTSWTGYSGGRGFARRYARVLAGYHMNGDLVNRG